MKTLYIFRHAKSDRDKPTLRDIDREICEKGKKDLKLIWFFLKEKKVKPDVIYSSPAKRAKQTIKKICVIIWYNENKIIYENWIYDNHMNWINYYLWFLIDLKNKHDNVFIVWHNPYSTELTNYLLQKDIWNIPTSSVVSINFDIDSWKDILDNKWKLNFFVSPKMVKEKNIG